MVLRLKAWKSRSPPGPASPPQPPARTQQRSGTRITHIAGGGPARPPGSGRGRQAITAARPGEARRAAVERHPGRASDPGPTDTNNAGWSSPVARQAHNLKVTGSNPVPATKYNHENKSLDTQRPKPSASGVSMSDRGPKKHSS